MLKKLHLQFHSFSSEGTAPANECPHNHATMTINEDLFELATFANQLGLNASSTLYAGVGDAINTSIYELMQTP